MDLFDQVAFCATDPEPPDELPASARPDDIPGSYRTDPEPTPYGWGSVDLPDDPKPEEIDPDEYPFPSTPLEDELEAQFCGQERAGCPGWSESAQRLRAHWRAFLDAQPAERRETLERIEADAYQSARRRKLALAAMDASQPEGT